MHSTPDHADTQDVEPCALLFRSDVEHLVDYGTPARRAVISALFRVDATRRVSSRMLEGDLLISALARRTISYKYDPVNQKSSIVTGLDKDVAKLLIAELVDSFGALENTLNVSTLVQGLLRQSVFCYVLPSVPNEVWHGIDKELRGLAAYVGATTLDAGNPVHIVLFSQLLIDALYMDQGCLAIRAVAGAHEPNTDEWSDLGGTSVILDYTDQGPPCLAAKIPSERGIEGAERLLRKSKLGPRERVVVKLVGSSQRGESPFSVDTQLGMPTTVTIGKKLVEYALNPNHPTGGNKARVFKAALDIEVNDADYLANQLVSGLSRTDVNDVRMDNYGEVAYYTDIPVLGRNGETRAVRAGWRVLGEQPIRLVTAYVLDASEVMVPAPDLPGVLPDNLIGDEKWAALEVIARERAESAACTVVPTPMILTEGWSEEGPTNVESEGECGGAYVTVKDGMKGFAGWLRRNNLGHKVSPQHQRIVATVDSQSYARAVAYANAYLEVLVVNKVRAVMSEYYD